MRILAIRGKNLASLASEFEILLEEGALQHAGLFAITGQTGAGKSTLLDALCLALYDQIPRLPKGNGVSIGHKDEDENTRINSHDVSSILRRGTANAYAEVDFIGSDKQTYRSRWEISRARNNVNGRLQPQKISLTNLQSNEIIGHKKTETLQEIAQRIGLSFDQFRRSVLLAQGDFAAFLKAKKDERSSLLEKMTGTDIYSQLSEAAFDRATKEKQALTTIQEKLHDKMPLSSEERLTLEESNSTLAAQLLQIKTNIEHTQKQLDWYASQEKLQQDLNSLQLSNSKITEQWDKQSEHRLLLKQVDEVQVLRPLLQQQEQADKECKSANKELKNHQQLLLSANEHLPALQKQVSNSEDALTQHKKSSQDAKPLLTAALILDSKISDSQTLLSKLQAEYTVQKNLLQAADTELATLCTEANSVESTLQSYQEWQEKHAQLKPLVNEWGRWENALIDLVKCHNDLNSYSQQLSQLDNRIAESNDNLEQLNEEVASYSKVSQTTEESFKKLDLLIKDNSTSHHYKERTKLEEEKSSLDKELLSAQQSFDLTYNIAQETKHLTDLHCAEQTNKNETAQLEEQQKIISSQLKEAQQAFNLLQAASSQSVKQLRAALLSDKPCSVCGSEDHPWADINNPLQQPIAEQEKRVQQLTAEKDNSIKLLAGQGSLQAQLIKELTSCQSKIDHDTSQQQSLGFSSPASESFIEQLKSNYTSLNLRYTAAKENEAQALLLQKQWNDSRITLEQHKEKSKHLQEKISQLTEKIKLESLQKKGLENDVSRETSKKEQLSEILSTAFSLIEDWQSLVFEDPSFIEKIQSRVKQWQTYELKKTSAIESLTNLKQNIKLSEVAAQQQLNHTQKINTEQQAQESNQQEIISQRQKYFSGKPVDEVSKQLESELHAAEILKQKLTEELNQLQLDIKTQQHSVEHWQTETLRREKNHTEIADQLKHSLQQLTINLDTLHSHLSKSAEWINAEKNQQELLRKEKQEIQVLLNAKQDAIKTHEKIQAEQTRSELLSSLQQQKIEQQQQQELKESCVFKLRTDDEKISAGQHLAKAITKQTKIWEQWESLNELIGSKNGQKFRVFAQGLTLETLLAYTNQHLQEFAKRYSLERVNGSDLELQVIDRDMADEIRSVHSLSGGESFLVSLALALGLASLSSNRIQVESLFIDEGFGSLDPETLDIAIASLDTLQSLGRKVAVISHVPALVERIGTQVKVEKLGGGHSVVRVISNN